MKSEEEIWSEAQKIRAVISEFQARGKPVPPMLTGMAQALGWTLDRLRSPSEAEAMIRRVTTHGKPDRVAR